MGLALNRLIVTAKLVKVGYQRNSKCKDQNLKFM